MSHHRGWFALGVGFWLLCAAPFAAATGRPDGSTAPPAGMLQLRTGAVATATLPNLAAMTPDKAFRDARHGVLQLDGPLTPARAAALRDAGVKLGDYLPVNSFIADVSAVTPGALQRLGFVRWAGDYRPEWRLDPRIGQTTFQTPERQAIANAGKLAVTVYLFPDETLSTGRDALSRVAGAEIVATDWDGSQDVFNVVLPATSVAALAAIPAVQYVEEYPEFTLRNSTDRWIVQSNIANVTPLYDHGLHGEGQILGHIDGRVAVGHCSFYDTVVPGPDHRKILAYNTTQGNDSHGTHTAGTAVGDAGVWTDTRGVAYLAKMVHNVTPSMTESLMFSRLDLHRVQGATVHTNSWGNDATTAYDGVCRAIDNFSWMYDDNLVCFAVTNQSYLKNPENAKNCLAIGASQDTPSQGNFCSGGTGPTADGRRKPEIFAPGCGTLSAYYSSSTPCNTVAKTGTSMACPAIAATGLLVRQYFTDGYYPTGAPDAAHAFVPSGPLIKAVLLNSAVDMTGISGYPSNQEGWGRVLADNALYFLGDARGLVVQDVRNNSPTALATGGYAAYDVAVNGATLQLRVTLVWHDAPAAINSASPPVNNLDLVVTSPTGAVYLGNVFSGGTSVTGGTADAKNNVEQVHVDLPELGIWTVRVKGTAVNSGAQGYAVVVTGDVVDASCPAITTEPATQATTAGDSVTFTVAATGSQPMTYQWRYAGVPLDEGGRLNGTTTATLTIAPADFADAGDYDVVVNNACGSATSAIATLTVWARGDTDCDGEIGFGDINPFIVALDGEASYAAAYPGCHWANADINADGQTDFGDINPFVTLLTQP